jgi:cell division protein FtsW (lipid II flippase)
MTFRGWFHSLLAFLVVLWVFHYALHRLHNAWGLVILGLVYVMGFGVVVNTLDLFCGRWIRLGARRDMAPTRPGSLSAPAQPVIIRRIILEEIEVED